VVLGFLPGSGGAGVGGKVCGRRKVEGVGGGLGAGGCAENGDGGCAMGNEALWF
jgi:hypothetical protein